MIYPRNFRSSSFLYPLWAAGAALAVLALAEAAPCQSSLALELVADASDGLTNPTGIASIPGDPRLFLVEIGGGVRVLDGDTLLPGDFLNVRARVDTTARSGLRAIAFHPDYGANGYVYLWMDAPSTSGATIDILLARMTRSSTDPNSVDPASFMEVLREPQANYGHGCGQLDFGPDGMLYALLGDGGNSSDPMCNSQNDLNLMGCLLRIDVDGGTPYAIPADNPFVGVPGIRDEIWQTGFRHPWKWSFDRHTGDLWIADVGQGSIEEIDFIPQGIGGLNFGWKVMEGSQCFNTVNCPTGTPPCGDPAYTMPIHEYDHSFGCSITGGYVYRGSNLPDFVGAYFFADFCSGRVWTLREDGGSAVDLVERTAEIQPAAPLALTAPVTFGESGTGELYVVDFVDKELYRIVRREPFVTYCAGSPNSTGAPGVLGALGSSSLAANDMELASDSLPPGQFGLFVYGPAVGMLPAGNGVLCVAGNQISGGVRRLNPVQIDGAGALRLPLDWTMAPFSSGPGQIQPGSTWAFQLWHRDSIGTGFDFSGALSVLFLP